MVLLLSNSTSIHTLSHSLFFNSNHHRHGHHYFRPKLRLRNRRKNLSVCSIEKSDSSFYANNFSRELNQPRTLFLGGYKRPEITVPNIVLQLSPEEVLDDRSVLKVIDQAVVRRVGIVMLNGGVGSGGRLYEAACLLKSVIRDRAYLMIAERVDIAAAVNASGVVLSDQGLPAIVARNTMVGSRSDSVVLPLVARKVQTSDAALSASSSEGADFLIYEVNGETNAEEPVISILGDVTVPIFYTTASLGFDLSSSNAQHLLNSGASGLVVSLEELNSLPDKVLGKFSNKKPQTDEGGRGKSLTSDKLKSLDFGDNFPEKSGLKREERLLIKAEKTILLEVVEVVKEAAPLMEEVSLLIDTIAQLDEPFLLAIVGEFNSGKSTVINALLGNKYLKDGVVPTTNEIMFLRYSELESSGQQRCERHPDGQYICYLQAPILKEMIIVDTPGTNVILQRQQRLTEEFLPRADLVLFVISADRPLTESEVAFLRYTQQWKKKVVFVLNKSDIYQNAKELEEAMAFIKNNSRKLLNVEDVTLYPVSARSALEAKLSASYYTEKQNNELSTTSHWNVSSFHELEKFLYSFLDGSTRMGSERIKLKLETPLQISLQLLSACQKTVREKTQQAKQDLVLANKLVDSVKEYTAKMESESISRKRQILSLIDNTQTRVVKVIDSTLQLSNLDLVASYALKEKSTLPATLRVRDDIISTALSDAKKQLGEYVTWLQSSNARERRMYSESFDKRLASVNDFPKRDHPDAGELQIRRYELSLQVIENFSAAAASEVLEKEIRLAFLGTFGGLGAAGLSASLLTSVLPTSVEDLLALSLCSAGGWFAISNFPARRQRAIEKVKKTVNALALKLEEAMEKDLLDATHDLEKFVKLKGKPYQDLAQLRLDQLLEKQDMLTNVEKKVQTLQIEVQNLHVSE